MNSTSSLRSDLHVFITVSYIPYYCSCRITSHSLGWMARWHTKTQSSSPCCPPIRAAFIPVAAFSSSKPRTVARRSFTCYTEISCRNSVRVRKGGAVRTEQTWTEPTWPKVWNIIVRWETPPRVPKALSQRSNAWRPSFPWSPVLFVLATQLHGQ